jgi:hypothetical protein
MPGAWIVPARGPGDDQGDRKAEGDQNEDRLIHPARELEGLLELIRNLEEHPGNAQIDGRELDEAAVPELTQEFGHERKNTRSPR